MRKLLFLLIVIPFLTNAQDKDKSGPSTIVNPADLAKLTVAKQKMYGGQFLSALNAFRELEKSYDGNSSIKYYVGLCYYSLGQYTNAREVLEKGLKLPEKIKPDIHLLIGKIYHQDGEVDKAIEAFKAYKFAGVSDEETNEDADLYLQQCYNAQKYMANKLSVFVSNMGPEINSKFDDKNPCITADSKKMVFTTRRPETTNDLVDVEGDGKYFENVYIATMDSASRHFTKAASIGNSINGSAHDACTSISPDGKLLFLYKNDVNDNASRGGNVFVSKQMNGKWKTPEALGKPINTTYWEGGVCISPDGKRYFFTSERKGGYGGSDIWMVEKKNKKEWGKPVNLGPEVNSKYDEAGMFLAPDGKTLFFCSNGPNSMGSYDIFRTVYENGSWSTPVNLGFPINSTFREGQLTVSADARYAYFSSNRNGGLGETDIYMVDLQDFAILEKDGIRKSTNGLSILKGTIREGFEGYGIAETEVMVKDEKGTIAASGLTNENGEYFFTLPGGKYTIVIRKKGYKEIEEALEITANNKETMVFEKGYLLKK